MPLIPGGPCSVCAAVESTIWYGKKDGPKYCRTNECKRAGGYLPPLRKRGRASAGPAPQQTDMAAALMELELVELIEINSCRRARPSPRPPHLPHRYAPLARAPHPPPPLPPRFVVPEDMTPSEWRNPLASGYDAVARLEYLVFGKWAGDTADDVGVHGRRWILLADLLNNQRINADDVKDEIEIYEQQQLDVREAAWEAATAAADSGDETVAAGGEETEVDGAP